MKKRKRIIAIAAAFFFISLIVLVAIRWKAWFYNPKEMPYRTPDVPARVLLTFGNDAEGSRFVSWVCGEEVDSTACLYLASDCDTVAVPAKGEVFESRAGKAAFYRCELKGLKSLSHYAYMVETKGRKTQWYHFNTADSTAQSFSFLYLGDVQDTINSETNRLLKKAVRLHPEVEFVAFGGDLTERPTDAYYAEAFRGMDSICTAMPVIGITGNHDYLKYLIRKCERRFALTFPYFLKGMEERDDENHLFALRYHNTDLFLLDSSREFFYLFDQKEWLEDEMERRNADHSIVFIHHPLCSVRRETNNLVQKWMFAELLNEEKADLVLQGHEHTYTRCTADETPLKANLCTLLPLYLISHFSTKQYRIRPSRRFYPVIQGSRFYQVIDVTQEAVTLKSYDATDNRLIDSVRIQKAKSFRSENKALQLRYDCYYK